MSQLGQIAAAMGGLERHYVDDVYERLEQIGEGTYG